jgi:ElaB/YqjD/DUF883 family membrane-anchored ribosome-binding protein
MKELNDIAREKLMADLKIVLADTRELLELTAGSAEGRIHELRARLDERMDSLWVQMDHTETLLRLRTHEVAESANQYVREHPWQSVGAAAGITFLLGLLIGRR